MSASTLIAFFPVIVSQFSVSTSLYLSSSQSFFIFVASNLICQLLCLPVYPSYTNISSCSICQPLYLPDCMSSSLSIFQLFNKLVSMSTGAAYLSGSNTSSCSICQLLYLCGTCSVCQLTKLAAILAGPICRCHLCCSCDSKGPGRGAYLQQ